MKEYQQNYLEEILRMQTNRILYKLSDSILEKDERRWFAKKWKDQFVSSKD